MFTALAAEALLVQIPRVLEQGYSLGLLEDAEEVRVDDSVHGQCSVNLDASAEVTGGRERLGEARSNRSRGIEVEVDVCFGAKCFQAKDEL